MCQGENTEVQVEIQADQIDSSFTSTSETSSGQLGEEEFLYPPNYYFSVLFTGLSM